ncbi:hypothetical protein SAMN06297129_1641 [Pseudooceanicola antarcticus]|uniref:Uncharacterized protein n=1 Tax=Pseudooceanicola antarcticus TaxID=1247613 RepID=A0A285IPJ4_9RHOB|nr:DUF6525 family protein [Pseudooceanicola antarcticus]PJE31450.1 hypothetical protein CVM39_03600 [Pseudooceanicola antarcticus]SNY49940.1 hypothetical protein SAMN06297129_1641 [Pseudooceanicola antarcticus]
MRRGTNLGQTGLRRRRCRGNPMADYDRLPPELRAWLRQAALPWSVRSARRAWVRALGKCGGDPVAAGAQLSRIEARQLESRQT